MHLVCDLLVSCGVVSSFFLLISDRFRYGIWVRSHVSGCVCRSVCCHLYRPCGHACESDAIRWALDHWGLGSWVVDWIPGLGSMVADLGVWIIWILGLGPVSCHLHRACGMEMHIGCNPSAKCRRRNVHWIIGLGVVNSWICALGLGSWGVGWSLRYW